MVYDKYFYETVRRIPIHEIELFVSLFYFIFFGEGGGGGGVISICSLLVERLFQCYHQVLHVF